MTSAKKTPYTAQQLCLFHRVLKTRSFLSSSELNYDETLAVYNLLERKLSTKALGDAEWVGIGHDSYTNRNDMIIIAARLQITKFFLISIKTEKYLKHKKRYAVTTGNRLGVCFLRENELTNYTYDETAEPLNVYEALIKEFKELDRFTYADMFSAVFTQQDYANVQYTIQDEHSKLISCWPENLNPKSYTPLSHAHCIYAIREEDRLQGAFWVHSSGRYAEAIKIPDVTSEHNLLAELERIQST